MKAIGFKDVNYTGGYALLPPGDHTAADLTTIGLGAATLSSLRPPATR